MWRAPRPGEYGHMPEIDGVLPAKTVPAGFVVAAGLGMVHAGVSLYWAAGGTFLLWSLGSDLLESFHGRQWLLVPIGAVKLIAAFAPVALAGWGGPARLLTRSVCWLGAVVLLLWGGVNTTVGNLVLAGVIRPESGFDRSGMVGHAYLWDPLFLAWGAALAVGLIATRGFAIKTPPPSGHQSPGPASGSMTRTGSTCEES